MTAGEMLVNLNWRVRNVPDVSIVADATAQGELHPAADVLSLMTHVQRLVNSHFGYVLTAATLTTAPYTQFYKVSAQSALNGIIRVTDVADAAEGFRSMDRVPYSTLWWTSRSSHRDVGTQFRAWDLIGRDLLVVYPAKTLASTVLVTGTSLLAAVSSTATTLALPEEGLTVMQSIMEALLLMRQRQFDFSFKAVAGHIASVFGVPAGAA